MSRQCATCHGDIERDDITITEYGNKIHIECASDDGLYGPLCTDCQLYHHGECF